MRRTELLIVEELLLLLSDDQTGTIAGEGTLLYPLGGAVLVELALAGQIETDEIGTILYGPRVRAVAGHPPADELLRAAYDKVAERPRGVQTLLIEIGADLREQVLDRLVERDLLRRETRRMLGLFNTSRLSANDPLLETESLASVRAVLKDGGEADARTAALVGLLSASGTLPQFHPRIPWSGTVYTRGKGFESGHWATEAVGIAMTRNGMATSIGSSIAVSTALNARS